MLYYSYSKEPPKPQELLPTVTTTVDNPMQFLISLLSFVMIRMADLPVAISYAYARLFPQVTRLLLPVSSFTQTAFAVLVP